MSYFILSQHDNCPSYTSNKLTGFKWIEAKSGTVVKNSNAKYNRLVFLVKGKLSISYNEFSDHIFTSSQIIFLPQSADAVTVTLEDSSLMILIYDNPSNECERLGFDSLTPFRDHTEYSFQGLEIRAPLMAFVSLLKQYMEEGLNCGHLHELKHRELFLLLRNYYSREERARLFYPVLGVSMDFKSQVLSHYRSAHNATELAQACNLSPQIFAMRFKKEFDESPYQWMQRQKACHIRNRLAQPQVPLKEIVYEFNFTCPSHFSKYCVKYLGETPAKLRQLLIADNQAIAN